MIAYVDTSVLLRVVLGERGALKEWRSLDMALASELIRVESQRTIDRARIRLRLADDEVASRRADLLELLGGFHIAPLSRMVLERASEPFPTTLRTLGRPSSVDCALGSPSACGPSVRHA